MRRLALPAVAIALATMPLPAAAQIGEAFGDIYLTLDTAVDPFDMENGPATICIPDPELEPFATINFYLVVRIDFGDIGQPGLNASNGFRGWEADVDVPEALTITSRVLQPPTSINVGDPSIDEFIVGTGINIVASTTPYAVVEYSGLLLAAAQGLELRLGPTDPSSFPNSDPMPPGWLEAVATGECTNNGNATECVRPFGSWKDCENTFILNYNGPKTCLTRCIIATEESSWGALKSRY